MAFAVRENAEGQVLYKEVEDWVPDLYASIRQGWFAYLKALKKRANAEILRKPKSGRVYIRRDKAGRRRRHVASAPGETHANLSGKTRKSLSWKVFGWEKAVFGYGVSTRASTGAPPWAPYLEYGTTRMAARPSLKNAIDDVGDAARFFDSEFTRTMR